MELNMKNQSMSSSKSSLEDFLGESWVDLSCCPLDSIEDINRSDSPRQLTVENYLRLLREAQKESNQSSAKGSYTDSKRSSPKSPPNSPVLQDFYVNLEEWKAYYINSEGRDSSNESEPLNEWHSRPDQVPPKIWGFRPAKKEQLSLRHVYGGVDSTFSSRKGLYTLFVTNLLSFFLGTGIGLWISKHGFRLPFLKIH